MQFQSHAFGVRQFQSHAPGVRQFHSHAYGMKLPPPTSIVAPVT